MLGSLYAHLEPPPTPPKVRLRERRHECGYYVRKVKGNRYQLRWWLPPWGSVNCGLYEDETEAERVRGELLRESARYPSTPLGLWRALRVVLARMTAKRQETPNVLPMWVRADKQGGYRAEVKKGGRLIACDGPFDDPGAAHSAMLAELDRQFPKPVATAPTPRPRLLTLVDLLAA